MSWLSYTSKPELLGDTLLGNNKVSFPFWMPDILAKGIIIAA